MKNGGKPMIDTAFIIVVAVAFVIAVLGILATIR